MTVTLVYSDFEKTTVFVERKAKLVHIYTQQLSGSAAAETQIWFVHQCDLICLRIIDSWILNVDFLIELQPFSD